MPFNIEAAIWYLFLMDSVSYFFMMLIYRKEGTKLYKKYFPFFARIFPVTWGYSILYLGLVLWAGSALWRLGVLPW